MSILCKECGGPFPKEGPWHHQKNQCIESLQQQLSRVQEEQESLREAYCETLRVEYANKYEQLRAELQRMNGELRDERLAFDHANNVVGKLEADLAASQQEKLKLERELYSACYECGSDDPGLDANCPFRLAKKRVGELETALEFIHNRVDGILKEPFTEYWARGACLEILVTLKSVYRAALSPQSETKDQR